MFAFYESDWFTITLEILFMLFIVYDTRRYLQTRKREYLLNIVLAVAFFFGHWCRFITNITVGKMVIRRVFCQRV